MFKNADTELPRHDILHFGKFVQKILGTKGLLLLRIFNMGLGGRRRNLGSESDRIVKISLGLNTGRMYILINGHLEYLRALEKSR